MTTKSKGVFSLDSSPLYGGVISWDSKFGSKYQRLLQDYMELQKENVLIKNKLKVSKQKKLTLAAEVGFLRRRFNILSEMKCITSSKVPNHEHPSMSVKRNKTMKQRNYSGKVTTRQRLPPTPELKHKKNRTHKENSYRRSHFIDQYQKPMFDVGYDVNTEFNLNPVLTKNLKGRASAHKETLARSRIPFLELNPKKRIHAANDTFSRSSTRIFDLNQDTLLRGKEISLPSRTPVFDLNEISTGDEEFETSNERIRFEEARKNLFTDEHQTDTTKSICRNTGEGSSHGDKRRISWLDPVALNV